MFGRYIFGKYPAGGARVTPPPIPPDDPFPSQIAIVPGPKRSVLVAAMLGALFLHQGIVEVEAAAGPVPEGSIHVTVPLFGQRPGYAAVTRPTESIEPDELLSSRQARFLPLRPYSGKTAIQGIPPEQPEDSFGGISVTLSDPQYRSRIALGAVPPEEVATPDELLARRAIYLPNRPYRGKGLIQTPPAEEPPVEDFFGATSITLSSPPYKGKSAQATTAPDEALPDGDISITLLFPEYLGKTVFRTIQLETVVVEADELLVSRRSEYLPNRPYAGKPVAQFRQPDEIDELLPRRYVQQPTFPYKGKTLAIGRQPTEIDELLTGRRSAYLPLRPYVGKSFTRAPQIENEELYGARSVYLPNRPYRGAPFINGIPPKEIDELENGRRRVFLPLRPYRGQTFTQGIPFPEVVVNEADELHRDHVVNLAKYRPHRWGQPFAGFMQPEDLNQGQVLDAIRLYMKRRVDVTFHVELEDEIELYIRRIEDTTL